VGGELDQGETLGARDKEETGKKAGGCMREGQWESKGRGVNGGNRVGEREPRVEQQGRGEMKSRAKEKLGEKKERCPGGVGCSRVGRRGKGGGVVGSRRGGGEGGGG